MRIDIVTERYYGENCYILSDEKSGKCAVIDPALPEIAAEVERLGLEPEFVLLTHGHFDHIGGVDEFIEKYDVPVYIHEEDAELLTDGYKNASSPIIGAAVTVKAKSKTLREGDKLTLGALEISVVHTPGHTRGSVCYFCDDTVFTGDTIFACDRGRTDLYGGDEMTILDSVRKLLPMLKGKTIYPGHGQERKF